MADAGGLPVTVHRLKTRAPYYEAVVSGAKPFEVRRDDRGFQRGDRVHLAETAYVSVPGVGGEWCATDREAEYEITYVLTGGQFGIEPGYVVLGLDVPRAYPGDEDEERTAAGNEANHGMSWQASCRGCGQPIPGGQAALVTVTRAGHVITVTSHDGHRAASYAAALEDTTWQRDQSHLAVAAEDRRKL